MNALTLIVQQHRDIETAARLLLVADRDHRPHVLRVLGDLLEAHMEMEETILYPTVRTRRDAKALDAYVHDHHDVRMCLVRLMHAGFVESPTFLDEAARLATLLHEHAREEEEAHLLPLLAASLSETELDELGDEIAALYQELRQHQPFRSIVAEARDHALQRVD